MIQIHTSYRVDGARPVAHTRRDLTLSTFLLYVLVCTTSSTDQFYIGSKTAPSSAPIQHHTQEQRCSESSSFTNL